MQNNENFAENQNFANAPLIRVELNDEGRQVVSARELHAFLEVQTDFTDWCKRMLEYDFVENQDFNLLKFEEVRFEGKRQVKREIVDYALTIDCAKHIAMFQRSPKGKQIRKYFLWCEENLKNSTMLFVHQLQYEQDVAKIYGDVARIEGIMLELYGMVLEFQKEHKSMQYNIFLLQRAVVDARRDIQSLKSQMEFTAQWLDEVEKMVQELTRVYGLDVECFVYIFLNPQNGLYKIGRSKNIGSRKKDFETVQNGLKLVFAIPTLNHDEAVSLENNLHKRFSTKIRFGEWYALMNNDLRFLQLIQEAHREHIVHSADGAN
jgi:phage anti-repressor protein